MAVFKKKAKKKPEISTSALPDIIFMLLFFFMVSTKLKEEDVKVDNDLPKATQLQDLDVKVQTMTMYIGKPARVQDGSDSRIQVNDAFVPIKNIIQTVETKRSEAKTADITVTLKIDDEVKLGIVTDVKMQLREAQALKVFYSGNKVEKLK